MAIHASRRQFLIGGSALALLPGFALAQGSASGALRIGYQKSSTLITVLKSHGTLEQRLAARGLKVSWHEFTSGLPLLEALNTGNVDFSADVADTVPIFAQAAGANLTFVAQEAPSPSAQAIVVTSDSPIRTLAELKGKKIGFTKAAGAHYLLIAALASAGLSIKDIEPAYLTPADGRAAFEKKAIDAWVIWDPFLTAALVQSHARVLRDGKGLASYQRYYLASTPYAQTHPEVIATLFNALRETGSWVKKNPGEAANLLSPLWGLPRDIVEAANRNRSYAVRTPTRANIAEQQKIADAFLEAGLLPRAVKATDVPLYSPA